HALAMEARVNGERWGGGNSRAMHHSFWDIIAYVSQAETLFAGEIIGSGTVGTGSAHELGRTLAPNDVIELEVEKIGVLRNRIVKP
ncbi:MAG: fumarylacetoacetate hydrolase family protein, partial [Rhodoplanes sp.]